MGATSAQKSKLRMDAPPHSTTGNTKGEQAVIRAAEALRVGAQEARAHRTNADLSETGRKRAARVDAEVCFWKISAAYHAAEEALGAANERERRLLAVPSPDLRLPGAAIREWESREYFRALDKAGKLAFVVKAQQGHHDAEEVLAALLNGPMVGLDGDVDVVRLAWETHRRESNQTETEAIASDKQSAIWAMASIGMLAVTAREAFGGLVTPLEILTHRANGELAPGWKAWGLPERAWREALRQDAARAMQTAA